MNRLHSNFQAFVVGGYNGGYSNECRGGGNYARFDILLLLIWCVELDDGTGKIEKIRRDTVSTLLTVHSAGLGDIDRAIRCLIYMYETNEQLLYDLWASEFHWGNPPKLPYTSERALEGTDHGQEWEWILHAIEIYCVRVTLKRYPVEDRIDIELGKDMDRNNRAVVDDNGKCSDKIFGGSGLIWRRWIWREDWW